MGCNKKRYNKSIKKSSRIIENCETSAIILDKKVIRASLNTIIKDNEPYEQVKEPIKLTKK